MNRTQPGQQEVNMGSPDCLISGRRFKNSLPSYINVRSAEKFVSKI